MSVRVGFIGTGKIANRHIEKLTRIKEVKFVSFCGKVSSKIWR